MSERTKEELPRDRNYTDGKLGEFVDELSDGEKTMLRVGGALPADPFKDMDPSLTSSDVSQMITIVKSNNN